MTSLVDRFHGLALRSRLALLVATAVAIAVAAVSVACWLLTRAQLNDELNTTLENTVASEGSVQAAWDQCFSKGSATEEYPRFAYLQIIDAAGNRCVASGSKAVKIKSPDIAVAGGCARAPCTTAPPTTGTRYGSTPPRRCCTDGRWCSRSRCPDRWMRSAPR